MLIHLPLKAVKGNRGKGWGGGGEEKNSSNLHPLTGEGEELKLMEKKKAEKLP